MTNPGRNIFCTTAALCLVALNMCACGNSSAPTVTNQNTSSTNQTTAASQGSTQSAHTAPVASPARAAPTTTTTAGGGEPVDTSKADAEIKRLEERVKKNSSDQATRLALAKAYTARGDQLTGVRQYRAALGDYRRALRLDPNDEQAQQMSGTIISILKSMGRDVPPEGQEPPPLPLKQ